MFKFIYGPLLVIACLSVSLLTLTQASPQDRNTELLRFKESFDQYKYLERKYERSKQLRASGLVSDSDLENELLEKKVSLARLKEEAYNLIRANQTVIIQNAVKTVGQDESIYVELKLKNTAEAGIFPEYIGEINELKIAWKSWLTVMDLHISLLNDGLNIANPYEMVKTIPAGKSVVCRFRLLTDLPRLTVRLVSNGNTIENEILLTQDIRNPKLVIRSDPFSQTIAYGSSGDYKIGIEGYGFFNKSIGLTVEGLPSDVRFDFVDPVSKMIINNIKLTRDKPAQDLILRIYMPKVVGGETNQEPINCKLLASVHEPGKQEVVAGKTKIELIPKGTVSLKLSFANMYYETYLGNRLSIPAKIMNDGSADLLNPRLDVILPNKWELIGIKGINKRIGSNKNEQATVELGIPQDVPTGDYEVRIRCTADNINAQTNLEEKLIRVTIKTRGKAWLFLLLLLLLILASGFAFWFIRRSSLK